jgi:hypothetical protein
MARNYNLYHDVVFMDATYSTNPYRMPLVVLTGVNCEGKNTILGFALIRQETAEEYSWVLQQLKICQKEQPKVILTDFDASICHSIERHLTETEHLLCQWHMMQNLKKRFIGLTRSNKLLYKMIVGELLFQQDPFKLQRVIDSIMQASHILGPERTDYIKKLV